MSETYRTTVTDKGGEEHDVTVEFTYRKGAAGSYWQPPDPDECEITAMRDAGGENIIDKLHDSEVERVTELLYEEAGNGTFDEEPDYDPPDEPDEKRADFVNEGSPNSRY